MRDRKPLVRERLGGEVVGVVELGEFEVEVSKGIGGLETTLDVTLLGKGSGFAPVNVLVLGELGRQSFLFLGGVGVEFGVGLLGNELPGQVSR